MKNIYSSTDLLILKAKKYIYFISFLIGSLAVLINKEALYKINLINKLLLAKTNGFNGFKTNGTEKQMNLGNHLEAWLEVILK